MRQHMWWAALIAAMLSGCNCSDGPRSPSTDAGTPGSGADAGTGGGDGGGGAAPTEPDAGTTVGVPPGGFVLDGGSGDGPGAGSDNVHLDPEGALVLGGGSTELTFAWIANANAGTVSKYDTRTGREVARYHVAVPIDGLGQPNGLLGNAPHSPSRTAVDRYGDVWVANRAPTIKGSVTKIANNPLFCSERNGTPGIQTSQDRNGDGKISTNPADREMIVPTDWADLRQYDECILFTTPVGPDPLPGENNRVKARALAIARGLEGSAGDVWVGVHVNSTVIKLNSRDGQPAPVNSSGLTEIRVFSGTSLGPYGAAIDGRQRLWVVTHPTSPTRLALVDTQQGVVLRDNIIGPGGSNSYGIAVDGQNRVWLAGWQSGPKAYRYTHPEGMSTDLGQWGTFDFTTATSQRGTKMRRPRGIAADDQGFIWMSSDQNAGGSSASQLIAFNGDTGFVKGFQGPGGGTVDFIDATESGTSEAIGVGLDTDGHPWVNNRSGNAIRIHRDTGEVLRSQPQESGLYTYSDFTGYQLRNFTAPSGSYRQVFTGCGSRTRWRQALWDALVPPGTELQVYITVSDSLDTIHDPSRRQGPFRTSPLDLEAAGLPLGAYLRIEFVLVSNDRRSSPKLKSFDVNYACAPILR